ncbi:MAG TPA: hypothetical protein VEF53_06080 [Patescibacteria group bacterium]|nr:hypothetical protein [Patescibacteria group bacterium]
MISKEVASNMLKEKILILGSTDEATIGKAFHEHLHFLAENYHELEDDLKKFYDDTMTKMLDTAKSNIDNLEDSIAKRQGIRMYKQATKDHYNASWLVQILEKPIVKPLPIQTFVRDTFIKRLQNLIDFLSDIVDSPHAGISRLSIIGLYYLCIDELLAAHHLTQHSFVNQAFAHIRSVLENMDKIELFHKQPEWAEIWASEKPEDKKKILFELSPKGVRVKLGKPNYDPMYSMFSELGTHGAFKGIQVRTGIIRKTNGRERDTMKFWMGGCPFEDNIIWTNSFLLYITGMILFSVTKIYAEYLLEEEVENILKEYARDMKKVNEDFIIPWASEQGLDVEPLVEMLNKFVWD